MAPSLLGVFEADGGNFSPSFCSALTKMLVFFFFPSCSLCIDHIASASAASPCIFSISLLSHKFALASLLTVFVLAHSSLIRIPSSLPSSSFASTLKRKLEIPFRICTCRLPYHILAGDYSTYPPILPSLFSGQLPSSPSYLNTSQSV